MDTMWSHVRKANPKWNGEQHSPTRRPANPPARFAFLQKDSKPDKKRGKAQHKNPQKKRICQRHSGVKNHCVYYKTMQDIQEN